MTGKNIEIKARVSDPKSILERIRALCKQDAVEINQLDTFFHTINGRLKLREFGDGMGELIYYNRKNGHGPKLSQYLRYQTDNPAELLAALTGAYGILGVIQKTRRLFLLGQTRVHFDHVKYLGDFLELEVVLDQDQSPEEGVGIAEEIMVRLNINKDDLIDASYIDLLHD